jgi:cAMP-dependent protein kinase regulator
MPQTLDDIIALSETHRRTKQWVKALKIYRLIMEAAPFDSEFRLNIADAVMALGYQDMAVLAYAETCKFCGRAGYPLLAIVAAKKLSMIKDDGDEMMRAIAGLFGVESETIGKTARLAPVERSLQVKEGIDLDYPIETGDLVSSTVQLMVAASSTAPFPKTLPPIPILSDLPAELFVKLLKEVRLLTNDAGQVIIREGEEADTFFIIAKGKVVISKAGGPAKKIELARLGEGSVFGEMALITQSPRTATVETVEDTELLEFRKGKLESLVQDSVVIEAALERFTRERLISNLLATNPIFQPFDRKQRYELLSRFTAHEVTPGTVLVRDGQVGRGTLSIRKTARTSSSPRCARGTSSGRYRSSRTHRRRRRSRPFPTARSSSCRRSTSRGSPSPSATSRITSTSSAPSASP